MRNGDALTQPRRSDLFPVGQTQGYRLLRHGMRALHMSADFCDKLALAGDLQIEEDVFGQ